MPKYASGLRDSMPTGKNVSQTGQLKHGARETKAWKATNDTKEYKTGSTSMGPLGGRNAMK